MAYVRHPNKFKPLLLDEARNAHKSGTHVFGQALEFGVNCFIQSFDNPSGSHYYTKKDILPFHHRSVHTPLLANRAFSLAPNPRSLLVRPCRARCAYSTMPIAVENSGSSKFDGSLAMGTG